MRAKTVNEFGIPLVKESISPQKWGFKEAPELKGLYRAGKNPSNDFEYSILNDKLKIKKRLEEDKFLMYTDWGPDIIIQIMGYDENS